MLPSGQNDYRFGLVQGSGHKKLKYIAYLSSPAFPLARNTLCNLRLTYTYGAGDQYTLKFVPVSTAIAPFRSLVVEWKLADDFNDQDTAQENAPIPPFPPRKIWSSVKQYDMSSFARLVDQLRNGEYTENDVKMLTKIIRNIWGDGRSILDTDAPQEFISIAQNGIAIIGETLISINDRKMRKELLKAAALLHKDAPSQVIEELKNITKNSTAILYNWVTIALAIGTARLDWQQELFKKVLRSRSDAILDILAISLWKDEQTIRLLTPASIIELLNNLVVEISGASRTIAADVVDERDIKKQIDRGISEQQAIE